MNQQTLIYLLLGLAFLTFVFWTVRDWMTQRREKEKDKKMVAPPSVPVTDKLSITLPLQLQAYERLVMFLERISPQNLINRLNQPGLTAKDMQQMMIQTIRAEFEHNISQQIYVSKDAWDAVMNAKEQLINLIIRMSSPLPPETGALELNKKLLELMLQSGEPFPTQTAREVLSDEAKKLMAK